jgi:VWFA-related protein
MKHALCALILVVLIAVALAGEQSITVDVDLVNIYFTVTNKKGQLIPKLGPESFSVFEDGAAQEITHFSRETDVPLTIVLLIDTSGSVRDKLEYEQQAAMEFFHSTLQPARDRAAVLTFDSSVEQRQDYTDDPELLSQAVLHAIAGGGTRLFDALAFSVREKLSGSTERKVIILLTDGRDNVSTTTLEEAVETARRQGVVIYTMSMNAFGVRLDDSNRGDWILGVLAEETGGKAYFPTAVKDLRTYFSRISKELRCQYTLGYRSTNSRRDGSFRTIQIDARNNRYSVRARPGYYAPQTTVRKAN